MQNTSYGGSMAAQIVSDDLAFCRENTQSLAGAVGTQAVDQATDMFNQLESAGNKIGAISRDADLTSGAKRQRAQTMYDQAATSAQASLNSLEKLSDDYQAKQERLGQISAPPAATVADREAVLTNIRADLRMVWDSVSDTALPDAMLESLREAVQNNDLNTAFLMCGSPEFARKYAGTRPGGSMAMPYFDTAAAQIIAPLLDTTTRNAREALAREQSGEPGTLGWLRQTMEVYRNGRLRELRNMAGL